MPASMGTIPDNLVMCMPFAAGTPPWLHTLDSLSQIAFQTPVGLGQSGDMVCHPHAGMQP